jgi:superfamily II DNA or RNA helicase
MSKKVELIRVNNILYIKPWITSLNNHLVCFRKVTGPPRPGKRGLDVKYIPETLYYMAPHTKTEIGVTYGGLFTRVYQFLQENGYEVEVKNHQEKIPGVKFDVLKNISFRTGQEKALLSILSSFRGRIKAPPGFGKTFVIELICKLYDKKTKILVVTTRSSVLTDIKRRITAAVPNKNVIQVSAGKPVLEESDIIVCSAKSLHRIPPDWPDLLLFDEVHGAAAPKISECLAAITKARMFGFSASPVGRSDNADLLSEAFFGPIICDIEYKEAQDNEVVCPIEVWKLPVNAVEIDRSNQTSRDRWNIWRNRTRNNVIKAAIDKFSKDTQILVLVNTVEHALVLKTLMPDFTVVYASLTEAQRKRFIRAKICDEVQPLKLDKEQIKNDFREGKIKRVISTSTWREGVDFPNLEVVVRADGTKGPIPATQIGGRLSRIAEGKEKGIVIDFTDNFGKCYINRSKNRFKNYLKEGWAVIDGYGTFPKRT